uniref:Uncharacterized protein n=1 Tax=Kalanchoe fedtschenkoi TaxID=63787 RepID=A0A7N0VA05_KALFE
MLKATTGERRKSSREENCKWERVAVCYLNTRFPENYKCPIFFSPNFLALETIPNFPSRRDMLLQLESPLLPIASSKSAIVFPESVLGVSCATFGFLHF